MVAYLIYKATTQLAADLFESPSDRKDWSLGRVSCLADHPRVLGFSLKLSMTCVNLSDLRKLYIS